jgi:hypothetical protein
MFGRPPVISVGKVLHPEHLANIIPGITISQIKGNCTGSIAITAEPDEPLAIQRINVIGVVILLSKVL